MCKKMFLVIACCMLLANIVTAQVYTIAPIYTCKTVELSKSNLTISSIDTFTRGNFIVDLDKMTFTNPVTILSTPKLITIKKFTRLDNNLIELKMKKDNKYSPDLYYLQLNAAGDPLYIQNADIIFTTYTSTPSAITLRLKCSRFKKVEVPYTRGDTPPDDTLGKAMQLAKYTEVYNNWELNNGTVTWTEGKGKNAIVHTITITSSGASTNPQRYYVQLIGKDEDGKDCNVMFCSSQYQQPAYTHVYVERIEKDSWVSMSFY